MTFSLLLTIKLRTCCAYCTPQPVPDRGGPFFVLPEKKSAIGNQNQQSIEFTHDIDQRMGVCHLISLLRKY